MTTPICSAHIVVGKLLSGLLQVVLLLAISLPVLAIVRVLGGVPWDFVLAGFCITLTASLLAGALSLLLSTCYRHPYDVVSAGAVVYLVVLVVLPAMVTALVSGGTLNRPLTLSLLDLTNPFRALYLCNTRISSTRGATAGSFFSWPGHCLAMAGVAAAMLWLSMGRIRRAGRASFSGGSNRSGLARRDRRLSVVRTDYIGDRRWRTADLVAGLAALAVCILAAAAHAAGTRNYDVYVYYFSWGLWMVALLRLAISAAGGITTEKEGGTWPMLLATPLDDERILRGKALAALRRNIVLLLSALAVQICFLLCASASPKALSAGLCLLSAAASVFFIASAGLFFGMRLRSTTAAVTAAIGAYLCLNYIVCGRYNPLFGWLLWKMASLSGTGSARFLLLGFGMGAATFVLDAALGMLLVRRALRVMRRHVF